MIRQLRIFVSVISVLFLLGSIGIYFSSHSFLKGLIDVDAANDMLDLTNKIFNGIDSSSKYVLKISELKRLSDLQYSFQANQQEIFGALRKAKEYSTRLSVTSPMIEELGTVLVLYRESVNQTLTQLRTSQKQNPQSTLKSDLLVAQQFELEIKEILRKIQIELKNQSKSAFEASFALRNRPLIVAVVLALSFFTLVLAIGSLMLRRLEHSISNLSAATDAVAEGDLEFRAKVIVLDEIGRLTQSFNSMVGALQLGRAQLQRLNDRISRLQGMTAAFSEAATTDQVMDVIAKQGAESLGACSSIVMLLNPDNDCLELKRIEGYPEEVGRLVASIPLTALLPLNEAVRTRSAVAIGSLQSERDRYPALNQFKHDLNHAFIAAPFLIGDRVLGGFGLSFSDVRKIDSDDQAFISSLATQCAQALYRAQLYENAQKAISTRDEFLSIASHELKTPITPLKLQLQLFLRTLEGGSTGDVSLDRLAQLARSSDQQLNRLSRLIDNLLDVSRINVGKLTLNREEVNLREVLEDLVSRYQPQATSKGSSIQLSMPHQIIGHWDKIRIEQVVANMIMNAIKYAPGKPIHVTAIDQGSAVEVQIRDEGPGIAHQDRSKIFNRFERIQGTSNISGLGLGLYISKQIVDAHGGKIWVVSEPGHGTTFHFQIPLKVA